LKLRRSARWRQGAIRLAAIEEKSGFDGKKRRHDVLLGQKCEAISDLRGGASGRAFADVAARRVGDALWTSR
jgi:hypothetical protein